METQSYSTATERNTVATFQTKDIQSLIVQLIQHLPENITVNFYIGHITYGDNSPIEGALSVSRINGDNNIAIAGSDKNQLYNEIKKSK